MDTFSVRLTGEDRAALRAAAAAKGVSETEMIRQLVRRGLAVESSDAQIELLVAILRRAIEPTRKLAYLALRESTKARYFARGNGAMYFLDQRAKGDREAQGAWRRERDYEANRAVQRVLGEPDPERGDEITVEAEAMEADLAAEEAVALTADQAEMFAGQDDPDKA